MTPTSILIVCAIALAFLLFGGVLAWGDFYSRRRPSDQASAPEEKPSSATAVTTAKWRDAA
jgi:hypothetical protein